MFPGENMKGIISSPPQYSQLILSCSVSFISVGPQRLSAWQERWMLLVRQHSSAGAGMIMKGDVTTQV